MNYLEKHPLTVAREKVGINKNQLAKKLGKHNAQMTMVEAWRRPLSYQTCMQIEKSIGCDAKQLHFDTLLAYLLHSAIEKIKESGISADHIDTKNTAKILIDIAKTRHEAEMAEYHGMNELAQALANGSLIKKGA
jgi:plasmid maintenance system antidote protein VapI